MAPRRNPRVQPRAPSKLRFRGRRRCSHEPSAISHSRPTMAARAIANSVTGRGDETDEAGRTLVLQHRLAGRSWGPPRPEDSNAAALDIFGAGAGGLRSRCPCDTRPGLDDARGHRGHADRLDRRRDFGASPRLSRQAHAAPLVDGRCYLRRRSIPTPNDTFHSPAPDPGAPALNRFGVSVLVM